MDLFLGLWLHRMLILFQSKYHVDINLTLNQESSSLCFVEISKSLRHVVFLCFPLFGLLNVAAGVNCYYQCKNQKFLSYL